MQREPEHEAALGESVTSPPQTSGFWSRSTDLEELSLSLSPQPFLLDTFVLGQRSSPPAKAKEFDEYDTASADSCFSSGFPQDVWSDLVHPDMLSSSGQETLLYLNPGDEEGPNGTVNSPDGEEKSYEKSLIMGEVCRKMTAK